MVWAPAIAAGTYFIRGVLGGGGLMLRGGRDGLGVKIGIDSNTGPPEPAPVYATTAALLMHILGLM